MPINRNDIEVVVARGAWRAAQHLQHKISFRTVHAEYYAEMARWNASAPVVVSPKSAESKA
jgi:hypothetical protein